MTARSAGEVFAGLGPTKVRRTFQPVRRDSRHGGEREHRIWRPLGATKREGFRFRDAVMKAAVRFNRERKQAGKENGPLGHIAIEVLDALFEFVDFKSGRLEPAIATICERIRRSRASVCEALARLKEHGFIDWIRRTEPTGNVGAGPQVRQISNAYGFDIARLPGSWGAWVRRKLAGPPVPDCEQARGDQAQAETERMLMTVSREEAARFIAGDDSMGDLLARYGRALDRSASSTGGKNPDA